MQGAADANAREERNHRYALKILDVCCDHLRQGVFLRLWRAEKGREWPAGRAVDHLTDPLTCAVKLFDGERTRWVAGDAATFDATLLCKLVLHCKWKAPGLGKAEKGAVADLRKMRNESSHRADRRVSDADFFALRRRAGVGMKTLGMDAEGLAALAVMGEDGSKEDEVSAERELQAIDESNEARARGNEAFKKGEFERAAQLYSDGIEAGAVAPTPVVAKCYANRAQAHLKMERYEKAASDAEMATKMDPAYAKAFARLGNAAMSLHDYQRASVAFERACALDNKLRPQLSASLDHCRDMAERDERNEADNPNYILGVRNERLEREMRQRHGFNALGGCFPEAAAHAFPERLRMLLEAENSMRERKFARAREVYLHAYTKYRDADGAYNVGLLYQRGRGTKKDIRKALVYFTKATECEPNPLALGHERFNGIGQSHTALAMAYQNGIGVRANPVAAVKHFRLAAQFMCPSGCNNLGDFYMSGTMPGVSQNLELAADLFRKSWGISHMGGEAAFNLGHLMEATHPETALHWYRAAANLGCPGAEGRVQALEHARREGRKSRLAGA